MDDITAAIALEISTAKRQKNKLAKPRQDEDHELNYYLYNIRKFAEEYGDMGIIFQDTNAHSTAVNELRARGFIVEYINGSTVIGWK